MKKRIAWITDSASSLTPQEAAEYNIHVVPVSVIFGEEVYRDGVDLSVKAFYQKLSNTNVQPTTSQPTTQEFVNLYEQLKEEYEIGIAVHISGALSGTLSGSISAAEMAGFPLIPIDSKFGAAGMVTMLKEGIRLEKEGKSLEEIKDYLISLSDKVKGFMMVGSLDQLYRGGRVSGLSYYIGSLLQIKPILTFDNGKLIPYTKVRTMKKAEKRVLDILKTSLNYKRVEHISIVHSEFEEKALAWKKDIITMFPSLEINIGTLSPAIGAHVGAGTIGILWFEA